MEKDPAVAPVEIGSLSHHLQVPGGFLAGFLNPSTVSLQTSFIFVAGQSM